MHVLIGQAFRLFDKMVDMSPDILLEHLLGLGQLSQLIDIHTLYHEHKVNHYPGGR